MQNTPEFYDVVSVTPDNPRSGEGDMAVLRDGRVLFAYTSFRGREDDARADIVDCFSADGGRTWSTPTVLVSNDEARENVMSASLLRLQSGAILLFYLRKDSRCDCRVWMRRSDDEAETWSDAVCCTSATRYFVIVNDCALQLADGRIVLPLESCEEVWTAVTENVFVLLGKQIRKQPPGTGYLIPPDGKTPHANFNVSDDRIKLFYFARYRDHEVRP